MHVDALNVLAVFVFNAPFVVIAAVLVHLLLKRAAWKRQKRLARRSLGYYPSTAALGLMFLFLQAYWRPTVAHVLEAKQDEEADEDENGDPETVTKQLNRQLKGIRRGEVVDKLVLRL